MTGYGWRKVVRIIVGCAALLIASSPMPLRAEPAASATTAAPTEHVILFVLEGVDQPALKAGPMPVLTRL
nr:hypothetical protein [Nitrospirota bacterium]